MECGEHDPPIALTSDQRPLFPYGTGHVRLSYGSSDEASSTVASSILHHETGGEIDHNRRGYSSAAASVQHSSHCKGQRVVLSNRASRLVHQRQTIDIGIYRQANVGTVLPYQITQLTQILRDRFGSTGEPGVHLEIDPVDLAPK